ncbi:MAG: integration host factor subunit beta [Chitinivibrionia bacterium]|nr:integration host factor subunit beta [Chitinivibrionia bacterium]
MSSVKKSDLVSKIAKQTGLAMTDAKIIVDELIDAIKEELQKGNTIELRGFATFNIKERRKRIARNMNTGENVEVAPKKDVSMKPCKTLKELVNK